MKTQRLFSLGLLILSLILIPFFAWGIDWIQYTERAVGEGHPTYADVANRPTKQLYALIDANENGLVDTAEKLQNGTGSIILVGDIQSLQSVAADNTAHRTTTGNPHSTSAADVGATATGTFEVEHNPDGTHPFSVPDTAEYALTGDGGSELASYSFTATTHLAGNFSAWGVVVLRRLGVAESFYWRYETAYSLNMLNIGKSVDNRLSVSIGANTYTSAWTLDANDLNRPIEVGVVCDQGGGVCRFIFDGETGPDIAVSFVWPAPSSEQHILGSGFQGDLLYWAMSDKVISGPSTYHSPLREGLSQCPSCLLMYDLDEGIEAASSLADPLRTPGYILWLSGGTWTAYSGGY